MKPLYILGALIGCILLWGCAAKAPGSGASPPQTGAVAVWNLEDLSPMGAPDLAEFLTARVLEVVKAQGQPVVEREKLLALLSELNLGSSNLASQETQLNIGRMSGAKRMIFGGYMGIGSSLRIDLRLVDVETGKILKTSTKTISGRSNAAILSAVEEAARALLTP